MVPYPLEILKHEMPASCHSGGEMLWTEDPWLVKSMTDESKQKKRSIMGMLVLWICWYYGNLGVFGIMGIWGIIGI